MSRYVRWQQAEHRAWVSVVLMLFVAPVFLALIPLFVTGVGRRVDRRLRLPSRQGITAMPVLGVVMAAGGCSLGLWSVVTQLARGGGTPLPVLPTQVLLVDGPYRYSRNPMTLGAVLAYLGVALAARSPSGVGNVLAFAASLVAYLKGLEEAELAERFGTPYLAYRRSRPFLIPRFLGPR